MNAFATLCRGVVHWLYLGLLLIGLVTGPAEIVLAALRAARAVFTDPDRKLAVATLFIAIAILSFAAAFVVGVVPLKR